MSLDRTLAGRRVILDHCADSNTRLVAGDRGTIRFVDDVGTLHVEWDSGSSLGLIDGEDRWTLVP